MTRGYAHVRRQWDCDSHRSGHWVLNSGSAEINKLPAPGGFHVEKKTVGKAMSPDSGLAPPPKKAHV